MIRVRLPDESAATTLVLRKLCLEAMGATTAADTPAALTAIAQMRWCVVDVPSVHGEFRQRFDLGLNDAEAWLRVGDLAAATTTLESVRRLVIEIERSMERPHGDSAA
ncbi:MAG TPA: hypothetical protein VJV79_15805 [Polyangiaceae bacterium]|nr:hypothetical protein [Polyangiaceae bacterium]